MELSPKASSFGGGLRRKRTAQEASQRKLAVYNSSVSSREKRSETGAREARAKVRDELRTQLEITQRGSRAPASHFRGANLPSPHRRRFRLSWSASPFDKLRVTLLGHQRQKWRHAELVEARRHAPETANPQFSCIPPRLPYFTPRSRVGGASARLAALVCRRRP
jgi:hypothetical protein